MICQNDSYMILGRYNMRLDGGYDYESEEDDGIWQEYSGAWRTDCDNCVYYCIVTECNLLKHHATYAYVRSDLNIDLRCICGSPWVPILPESIISVIIKSGFCNQVPMQVPQDTVEILIRGWGENSNSYAARVCDLYRKYELSSKQEKEGLNLDENRELRNLVLAKREKILIRRHS